MSKLTAFLIMAGAIVGFLALYLLKRPESHGGCGCGGSCPASRDEEKRPGFPQEFTPVCLKPGRE